MQQPDHPAKTDASPVMPVAHKPRDLRSMAQASKLPELRRHMMTRPVVLGALIVLLVLHFAVPDRIDLATVLILAGLYLLVVGSGGLEAARLSGTGGDLRRLERLTEDALRRAGRLQSHLEPCSATDDVVNRILASSHEPRRMVILAGNEVEDALRAVYRHYSEAERMASTSNGTDLPLTFLVQELIWRGLLAPDIYDTAEPILSLREIALDPRAAISSQIAADCARATQAVILRVQSLGIAINPRRVPLAWLRPESAEPDPLSSSPVAEEETQPPAEVLVDDDAGLAAADGATPELPKDTAALETLAREPIRRELRTRHGGAEASDIARS